MTDTICWKCANACGGCEWSKKRAKPVAGWEAIRRDLYDGIESYIVLSCPEFEPDRPETQKESKNTRVWTADETRRLHEMRKNGMLYNGKEIVQCGCCKLSFTMDDENCIKNIFGDKVVCCPECHSTYLLSDVH